MSFSQKDTNLNYPRKAFPGEIVRDTCIQFTPEQVKYIVEDAINADSYKEENDSLKSIVKNYEYLVSQKDNEVQQLNLDLSIRTDIIEGYKQESNKYKTWFSNAENRLKLTKKVDMIVYPILGSLVLTGVLYIGISSVK